MRKAAVAGVLVATAPLLLPAASRADDEVPRVRENIPQDRLFAVGAKLGLIPPILTVAEVLVRPTAHLALGLFGIWTPGVGIGSGGHRTSVGGELIYEIRDGRRGTPYLSLAYAYYYAAPNSDGIFERSHVTYATGGYAWKADSVEFYLGGGLLFILVDEKPCTGFCVPVDTPPVLPTAELGLRFAFL